MKSSITCGCRLIEDNKAFCLETEEEAVDDYKRYTRCVDVPSNVCRMKPVNSATGKRLERKFTVNKEGVKEEW